MERQLFVTDLDGTLLGADCRVSARSAAIISEISRRGGMITVATARTPATVEPLLADTLTLPPAVVLTGAALWERAGGGHYRSMKLLGDEARRVVDTALAVGLHPIVYRRADDGRMLEFYYEPDMLMPVERKFVDDRSSLQLKRAVATDDVSGATQLPGALLVLATGPHESVITAVKILRSNPRLSVSYYTDPVYPGVDFLEVFGAGVSKAEGIRQLRELTGAEYVTVFGDNFNDLPMMAVADHAVAVGNALPEVKASVDEVIGPNTADSVAQYIADKLGIRI